MIEILEYTQMMYVAEMSDDDIQQIDGIWMQLYAQMIGWA